MSPRLADVILAGPVHQHQKLESFCIVEADTAELLTACYRLRSEVFVVEQGIFSGSDRDDFDDDPRVRALVAITPDGDVVGAVRIHPMTTPDLGWWRGSRLAVARGARRMLGVGPALVRAACALAESSGALRFDAMVQAGNAELFSRLGWVAAEHLDLYGQPHVRFDWPIARIQRLVDATKSALGPLLAEALAHDQWRGDDGSPVPGTDVIAATDAIIPSMVERDPEWAGWCAVLVNVNDLCAMGATPLGLMDVIGARDASFARRILRGLRDASQAWGVPVLGGHTQLGVPAALSVTALGRTDRPVPGGGGAAGQQLRLTADLGGGWRSRYTGAQWDSTSTRSPEQLRSQAAVVPALHPTAAKDVSMAGVVGTTGMLAEASGCRALLDVASIPAPDGAATADWLTCFPGFAIVSAESTPPDVALPPHLTTSVCGELATGSGVALRWPDGVVTEAVTAVTGLGAATDSAPHVERTAR